MHSSLIRFLKCLFCTEEARDLELHLVQSCGAFIGEGWMKCAGCHAVYPIVKGIPRMQVFSPERFRALLESWGVTIPGFQRGEASYSEKKTADGFDHQIAKQIAPHRGFPETFEASPSRKAFFLATEMEQIQARAFFENKVFLDVGLGAGQYSREALSLGAEVISIDINQVGVAAYHGSYGGYPKQHVIEASALKLPFRSESVDYAWSMGVLHHTEDLLKGFREMARALKVGGILNVGVYYQYKHWQWYRWARRITTRMPYERLRFLCLILAGLSYVRPLSFLCHPWVTPAESFQSRVTGAFDHYHPPFQTYVTPSQVEGWYREIGCFQDIHMTPIFNNFIGVKNSAQVGAFSDSTRQLIRKD